MRQYVFRGFSCAVLSVLVMMVLTTPLHAEYYEESMERPAISSPEYEDDYTESDDGQIKESVWTGGVSWRKYNVYLPNGETETMPYARPAVVLLHGAARSGASLVERWREISDRKDVILLGPHAGGGWNSGSDAQYFIPAMLKAAIEKYNIDPKRIYVFGHSMGGIFASVLALSQPEGFAAIGVHAGMLPPNAFAMLEFEGRKTPLVFINGTHDKGFPLADVRRTANAFSNNDHHVELYVLENHGHWYYDIAHDINELAWSFFENRSLD